MRKLGRDAGQSNTTQPKGYVFPTNSHIYPIPRRALSKGHVHLAPRHGITFLDLAAAFNLDIKSDSYYLAPDMNFDDVEERDGL